MKKLIALATLAPLLLSLPAPAQVDQDPDGLGMYFDTDATQYCLEYVGGEVSAYVILTNCSEPTSIAGWECHVTYTIPPGNYELGWWLNTIGGENVSAAPDFQVGLPSAMPYSPAILLAVYRMLIYVPDPIVFYVGPCNSPTIPGYPAYAVGGDPGRIKPMYVVSGSYDLPVAQLNGVCSVIATEHTTFGHIKAMFR